MNQKQYIESIVKQLKCSKKQKEEIKRQLMADVESALQTGETMDEIIERMGLPEEVAEEFNENLPQENRKFTKKKIAIMVAGIVGIILLVLVLLIYWWLPKTYEFGTSGLYEEKVVEQQARLVTDMFLNEDYEGLLEESDVAMQELFETQGDTMWDNVKTQISSDWGAFVSYDNIYMAEVRQMGKRYVLVQLNARYENISVTYTITFDEEMQLAGFYLS